MKAFVIDNPGKFSFREVEKPSLKKGEILLRIRKIGYCGSDLNTWRGKNPLVRYPRIPGHEISAEIAEIDSSVPAGLFQTGESVTALPYTSCGKCSACLAQRPNACKNNETLGVQREGALTEFIALPWAKVVKSEGLDVRQLAVVEPLAIGVHAGRRCDPKKGERMLVFGCGMVGLGAIAEGVRAGAEVIAVDVDDRKLQYVRALGAAHTINSRSENLNEKVAALTEGHGPRVVLEAIGLPETFVQAVDLASFAGRVVYVGYAGSPVTFDTKYFVMKEISIRGSRGATMDDFRQSVAFLQSGAIDADQVITREYAFADAGQVLADWDANPGAVSRILVTL
jgi:2-desacetyl-2-hydroxyethyl bacteriochlorophyllide A dehydrogenase